ncbi:hypothetical protein FRC01_006175 [Tulasnella sp. 417]|nr:hypothetical protein FRC01_006175 [Tulasnella sp. 417]
MSKRKITDDAGDDSSAGKSVRRKLEEASSVEPVIPPDAEPVSAPTTPEFAQVSSREYRRKFGLNLPGADVFYQPDLVDSDVAQQWYTDLLALDTSYSTTPSFTLKYSGQTVDMHYPYPSILQEIQKMVEDELGVTFNHVMLNRYDDGTVYIGKHSDHIENKASKYDLRSGAQLCNALPRS